MLRIYIISIEINVNFKRIITLFCFFIFITDIIFILASFSRYIAIRNIATSKASSPNKGLVKKENNQNRTMYAKKYNTNISLNLIFLRLFKLFNNS